MLRHSPIIGLLFAATLLVPSASAYGRQTGDLPAADTREIHDYTLTMDKIHKMSASATALKDFGKRHPELKDEGDSKSISEMVAKIEKYPEAAAAIRQGGMAPREFFVCLMTLMQASMAVGFKQAGTYKEYPPEILQNVSKANLDFTEQHWSEIQTLLPKDSEGKKDSDDR